MSQSESSAIELGYFGFDVHVTGERHGLGATGLSLDTHGTTRLNKRRVLILRDWLNEQLECMVDE